MASTILTFPEHLSGSGFEWRHVKIHVMQNTNKLGSPTEELNKAIEVGKKTATAFATKAGSAVLDGDAKKVMESINEASQGMKKIFQSESIVTINLPIPNSLSDSHNHEWSATTGIVGTLADKFYNGNSIAKGVAAISDTIGIRKPLADPGYFQDYAGTRPRNFTLSFDFIPQNPTDAASIYLIIQTLRKYSLPEGAVNGALILAPNFFQIEFPNPFIDTMINAREVVLTNISTDFGADGFMQTLPDGMPKYIKLSLSFAERGTTLSNTYAGAL